MEPRHGQNVISVDLLDGVPQLLLEFDVVLGSKTELQAVKFFRSAQENVSERVASDLEDIRIVK